MLIGNKIKSLRKDRKLSQKELCDGICSQGMLSQIEKDKHIPNVNLLSKLCARLEISINELEYATSDELNDKQKLITNMSDLFYQRKYVELFKIVDSPEFSKYFFTNVDKQLLSFYKALYYGFVQEDYYKSFELLEESLAYTYHLKKSRVTYKEIVILNNLAIITMKLNMLEDTYNYIELTVSHMNENEMIADNEKLTLVFYNIANIYSKLGDFAKALKLAKMGINWANKPTINTQIRLSYLYYAKAYSEQMLQIDTYKESYKVAYYLALNAKDDFLMKYIKTKITID